MFPGLDQTTLLWIGVALFVILGIVWLSLSISSSRETLKGAQLLLDRDEEDLDKDEDDDTGTRAG